MAAGEVGEGGGVHSRSRARGSTAGRVAGTGSRWRCDRGVSPAAGARRLRCRRLVPARRTWGALRAGGWWGRMTVVGGSRHRPSEGRSPPLPSEALCSCGEGRQCVAVCWVALGSKGTR